MMMWIFDIADVDLWVLGPKKNHNVSIHVRFLRIQIVLVTGRIDLLADRRDWNLTNLTWIFKC